MPVQPLCLHDMPYCELYLEAHAFIIVSHHWPLSTVQDILPYSYSCSSTGPGAYAPDAPQPIGLLWDPEPPPPWFRRSSFCHQAPLRPYDARDPSSERWNCGRECWPIILPKCRLPRSILGIFYVPQICDMGPTVLLPLRRKARWGLFCPEKFWRLRPGLNPRTWVLQGSTLPLDHRSHSDILSLRSFNLPAAAVVLFCTIKSCPLLMILITLSWKKV